MSDLNYPSVSSSDAQNRTMVLLVYGLYLIAIASCGALGIAGIAGVILAYVKRDDAPLGSLWRTHLENQIASFWIWFIFMAVGIATVWLIVGFVFIGFGLLYFMFRTLKGLVRAVDSRPY